MIESKNIFGERIVIGCLVEKDLLMIHYRSFNDDGLLEGQGTISLDKREGPLLAQKILELCK